jgi:DNA-directed RNA polymerase subunit RPC12/RpoP
MGAFRLLGALLVGALVVSLLILGLGQLANVAPGAPLVAIPLGLLVFALGVRAMMRAGRSAERFEGPPEDVAELDVFFVCVECGTEFRVEKLGELQVPRHCGERMAVERRPRTAPGLN